MSILDDPPFGGNPFEIGKFGGRYRCIEAYRELLNRDPRLIEKAKTELKGKVLGCWCSPKTCHGDVLSEIANSTSSESELELKFEGYK